MKSILSFRIQMTWQVLAAVPFITIVALAAPAAATTPSRSGTIITPGKGSITDASGNVFLITAAGAIEENGKALPGGSGTGEIEYCNSVVYFEDATTHAWYTWSGSNFVGNAEPSPTSQPPSPTTSPSGTIITPGKGSITDASGNVFTLTAAAAIQENGKALAGGGGTSEIEYSNGTVYFQDATTHTWYTWNGSNFVGSKITPPTQPAPVSGVCGTSNAANLTSAPTTGLCDTGMASAISGTAPWNWSCAGSNGGTTATCSAFLKTNGSCGVANEYPIKGVYYVPQNADLSPASAAQVISLPYVNGVDLEVYWSSVEPSSGVFDWSFLDKQIAIAQASGKNIILGVSGGGSLARTPQWLFSQGVAFLDARDYAPGTYCGQEMKIPLPWDQEYQQQWAELIRAMGAHYASNPSITGVMFEGINYYTPEIGFPTRAKGTILNDCPAGSNQNVVVPDLVTEWQSAGYSAARMDEAATFFFHAYKQAFPGKAIILQILQDGNNSPPIDGEGQYNPEYNNLIATDFFVIGKQILGSSFAAQFNGLKLNGAPAVERSLADISALKPQWLSAGLQQAEPIIPNSSDYPGGPTILPVCFMNGGVQPCIGAEVLQANLDLAVSDGTYVESFRSDLITSPALWTAVDNLLCHQ
jgi:Beta-galactosidase